MSDSKNIARNEGASGPERLEIAWLADVLGNAAYVSEAITQLPGVASSGRVVNLRAAVEATEDDGAASSALRLFLLARAISRHAAAGLLGSDERIARLMEIGLLISDEAGVVDSVRASCAIQCVNEGGDRYYLARDFAPDVLGGELADDHVLGVALATRSLAIRSVRRPVGAALDLGTGQGFQALLASRNAGRVVATDVSGRALRLAAWSCSMNAGMLARAGRIELREGGLYEPLREEEKFGLIVSNPPFMIAPPHGLVSVGGVGAKEAGDGAAFEGDEIVEAVLRGAPAWLEEGGYACVFCNWHHPDASSWRERPRAWLDGLGVDVLVQRLRTDSPEGYASRWIREIGYSDDHASGPTQGIDRWIEYYARLGIGGISLGMIYLRKRSAAAGGTPNWFRADVLDEGRFAGERSGQQVERIMRWQTVLERAAENGGDGAVLLETRPRLAPDHELEQTLHAALGEGWHVTGSLLRQTQGYQFPIRLQGGLMDLLVRFDGQSTLREIVETMATEAGADAGPMLSQAPMIVRRLGIDGYLE